MKVIYALTSHKVLKSKLYIAKFLLEKELNRKLSEKYSDDYSVVSKNFVLIACFDELNPYSTRLYRLGMKVLIKKGD